MITYKFSRKLNKDFSTAINKRVGAYFKENQISKNANAHMVQKTVAALSIYLIPYAFVVSGAISSVPLLFGLWIVMGVGKAFIGTSVMHDVLHGSYSKKKSVNKWMQLSPLIIGVDPTIWKLQHNVLHHTFTNIEDADEDIDPRYVLRFTPHQPRRWFHRFQHIYAIFFYSLSTLIWVFAKDYVKTFRYRKMGLIKPGKEFKRHLISLFTKKALYYTGILVVPMLVLPVAPWMTLLMFLTMHLVTGFLLGIVFQPAHVMPEVSFVKPETDKIKENWTVHQLYTTTNYAMDNKIISWFTGGLNYQIEHHLFPHVCHVHYPQISKIVRQTAEEFNMPYYTQKTFGEAMRKHFGLLKELGKPVTEVSTGAVSTAH